MHFSLSLSLSLFTLTFCTATTPVPEEALSAAMSTPQEKLAAADVVCFDVDSTVCIDEGIDELAGFLGKKDEVARWTKKAMEGGVTFQESLSSRLEIMKMTKVQLDTFVASHPPKLSPGVAEFVKALHAKGVAVYLVSGGFTQMIHPIADLLGVSRERVHANTILFGDDGAYAGFDKEAFTCKTGGKPDCLRHLKEKYGYKHMVMIGDGATDLEARQPGAADFFIGYGGVQVCSFPVPPPLFCILTNMLVLTSPYSLAHTTGA